jgi:transcriptional regulator with XRE-family HTH domain
VLKAMGRPIPATGITRIEKGQRRVDAGELCALAVALDVSPLTLLLPWEDDPDAEVGITDIGIETVTARTLWEWAGYSTVGGLRR